MKSNWIVVANKTNARIFIVDKLSNPLEEKDTLVNPKGRLHDRELTSDLPGKMRAEEGIGGHAFEQPTDPKKHEIDDFAKSVADYLENARDLNKLERLLLVADPSFLGFLRKHLSDPLKKTVCFELDKNIVEESIEEIRQYIPKHV